MQLKEKKSSIFDQSDSACNLESALGENFFQSGFFSVPSHSQSLMFTRGCELYFYDVAMGWPYDTKGRLANVEGDLVPGRFMDATTLGGPAFVYDENGNMEYDISKVKDNKSFKVSYRSDNLPSKFEFTLPVTGQSGQFDDYVMYMVYNNDGSRVNKVTFKNGSYESTKSYFGSGKEIRENVGSTVTEFNQLAGVGRIKYTSGTSQGTKEFYLKDHLGTTRQVYELGQGEVTYAYQYHPYGKQDILKESSTGNVTEKFTGKEKDEGIELSYFGARYYDADIAMWISPDPARQFHSPYVYGSNNPLNAIDPDGNAEINIGVKAGGGLDAEENHKLSTTLVSFNVNAFLWDLGADLINEGGAGGRLLGETFQDAARLLNRFDSKLGYKGVKSNESVLSSPMKLKHTSGSGPKIGGSAGVTYSLSFGDAGTTTKSLSISAVPFIGVIGRLGVNYNDQGEFVGFSIGGSHAAGLEAGISRDVTEEIK